MPLGNLKLRRIRMQLLVRLPAFIALALRCVWSMQGLGQPRGHGPRGPGPRGHSQRGHGPQGQGPWGHGPRGWSSGLVKHVGQVAWPQGPTSGPTRAQLGPN